MIQNTKDGILERIQGIEFTLKSLHGYNSHRDSGAVATLIQKSALSDV